MLVVEMNVRGNGAEEEKKKKKKFLLLNNLFFILHLNISFQYL